MFRPQSVNAPGVNGAAQKLVHFILWVGTFLGISGKQGAGRHGQADIGRLTPRDTVTWVALHGHLDWSETPGRPPESWKGQWGLEPSCVLNHT